MMAEKCLLNYNTAIVYKTTTIKLEMTNTLYDHSSVILLKDAELWISLMIEDED